MATRPDTPPASGLPDSGPPGSGEDTGRARVGAPSRPAPRTPEPVAGPVPRQADRTEPTGPRDRPRPGRLRRARSAARRSARRTAAAAGCGLALAAAFPPYGVWPLSVAAVAGLALAVRGRGVRQGAWLGFAFGFPFFLWLLRWLHVVGWDAVVGLSAVEAAFLAVLGAGLALTSRLPLWPLWGPCLWVAEELARDRLPFGGFPWGRLAFANTGSPYTALAALGGAPLVTFAVALSGSLLAAAVLRLRRGARGPLPPPAAAGGALALALAVGAAGPAVPTQTRPAGSVRVAVVQGDVQQPGMHFLGRPMKILDNHVRATLALAAAVRAGRAPRPDLVIWPENSSDLDPFAYPAAYDKITEAVRAVGVPVLVGALVDGPDATHVRNEGIVWDPVTGPGASYTKQHPVPFGEYVPFRRELTKVVKRLDQIPRDFYPGRRTGVLPMAGARLGDVICFEVAYDEIVRGTVEAGAQAIVVQTNNATYGLTGQPEQQLAMSKLRAVEHGRAVVTAATSGISAVVEPDGVIRQRTREFTRATLSATIPLREGRTVADRVGATPEWMLAIVGLLSCAAAIVPGRRELGDGQSKGQ